MGDTHCLHGQDEASGSSSVADWDACTTRNDPLPTNVKAAQESRRAAGLVEAARAWWPWTDAERWRWGYRDDESGAHEELRDSASEVVCISG